MEGLVGIAIFVLRTLLVFAIIYSGFISWRNTMRHAFSSIDAQLKKRRNLIPNLVETVKGYAKYEHEVLKEVMTAR